MALTSSISIGSSVGKGGGNAAADVRTVQARLNALMPPGRTRLAVDGKCGPLTIAAIREFQTVVCGMRWPDGRVDPGGKTISALSDEGASRTTNAPGPHSPAGAPTTPAAAPQTVAVAEGAQELLDGINALPAAGPERGMNSTPNADGDLTEYEAEDFRRMQFFSRTRRAIFVNGMQNSATDHRDSATLLSSLLRCPVYGLYNASEGFGADFKQCINDKASFLGRSVASEVHFSVLVEIVDQLHAAAIAAGTGRTARHEIVEWLLDGNRATLELYRKLRSGPLADKRLPIYAHSQGNLITSNALAAVALADGLSAIRGREVHSYGSPVRWWPPGLRRSDHVFTLDVVPLFRLRQDMDSVSVLNTFGDFAIKDKFHAFELYMKHDPDFLINSSCWTVRGYFRVINTEALALLLFNEGNNPARITGVFKRLVESHWGEDDDVALSYCRKMKQHAALIMRTMVRDAVAGRAFADVLVTCLVGRTPFASADEKAMASWVQSLAA